MLTAVSESQSPTAAIDTVLASGACVVDVAGVSVNAHLLICDDRGNANLGGNRSAARALLLTRNGRARLFKDLDYITALAEDCP